MKTLSKKQVNTSWQFQGQEGAFEWTNPHSLNQLYFPICNEAGMMASVTPTLNGDSKTGQHTFFLLPVSVEDLHNNRSARNFWIHIEGKGAYSLTGNSAKQNAKRFTENDSANTTILGEMLAHHLIRDDQEVGIKSEIINFCPTETDAIELMWVKITNTSNEPITFDGTSAIPIFGRSAENIRDHKHATSLIHRQETTENSILVSPVIYHDERGHKPNDTIYFALGFEGDGSNPIGQFPTVMEFIGEGGSFDWPRVVVENIPPYDTAPNRRDGMESVAAFRFKTVTLAPNETKDYVVIMGVTEDKQKVAAAGAEFGSTEKVAKALEENRAYWKRRVDKITFTGGDPNFSNWMRWITLQPMLRKIYGCSFLPHHDYGKGGRGWRDLWQDCLAFLLQNPEGVQEILVSNFGGVRSDGTNATIIGAGLGNFSADRNSISRVWMDHGVWPLYTTKLYIDQTGDFDILLKKAPYWKDHQIFRAKQKDEEWQVEDGNQVKTKTGEIYQGTILEHLLVQHLTCVFNVGEHGNIKLEDGDWNDQLDMAPEKGETIPFTAFYGSNLIVLADILETFQAKKGLDSVRLAEELLLLTDLADQKTLFDSIERKQTTLERYFKTVARGFSGKTATVDSKELANDLRKKGEWILNHVREHEWIESKTGVGFFNGYYNNDGESVDGDKESGVRMNLTAQTFTTMSGAATDEQVRRGFEAASQVLKDPETGGFRLTTPLGPNTFNLGRGFALVYGEKETGAMFSHMAVMYMNSLYRRGFVEEGFKVFNSLYNLCNDTERAKIYPGMPEYITHEGRGMYHYLTGSASWMLMTVLTEIYGVKGSEGDLVLHPRLQKEQFSEKDKASCQASFGGRRLEICYLNPNRLEFGSYKIKKITINDREMKGAKQDPGFVRISQQDFKKYFFKDLNSIKVVLDK